MAPVVVAFGLLLSLPTVKGLAVGQIDAGTAVARALLALAVAWAGVSLVQSVVRRQVESVPEEPAPSASSGEPTPS